MSVITKLLSFLSSEEASISRRSFLKGSAAAAATVAVASQTEALAKQELPPVTKVVTPESASNYISPKVEPYLDEEPAVVKGWAGVRLYSEEGTLFATYEAISFCQNVDVESYPTLGSCMRETRYRNSSVDIDCDWCKDEEAPIPGQRVRAEFYFSDSEKVFDVTGVVTQVTWHIDAPEYVGLNFSITEA